MLKLSHVDSPWSVTLAGGEGLTLFSMPPSPGMGYPVYSDLFKWMYVKVDDHRVYTRNMKNGSAP